MGGIVRDSKGAPLSEVLVHVSLESAGNKVVFLGTATTDAHGAWSFPSVPKTYRPIALSFHHHPGCRSLSGRVGTHGVPEAATLFARQADVRLAEPFPVTGLVRAGEKPIAGAHLDLCDPALAHDGQADADPDGHFRLHAENEGEFILVVTAEGWAPQCALVKIAVDAAPLAIQLEAGRPLQGRLLRGPNTPVAHAPVFLQAFPRTARGHAQLTQQPVIATTDAEGRFTWPHAPKERAICSVIPPETGEPLEFQWDTTNDAPLEVDFQP